MNDVNIDEFIKNAREVKEKHGKDSPEFKTVLEQFKALPSDKKMKAFDAMVGKSKVKE